MAKLTVTGTAVINGNAVIEFSNGVTGVFDAEFLLDHISRDGNQDVTNINVPDHRNNKKRA